LQTHRSGVQSKVLTWALPGGPHFTNDYSVVTDPRRLQEIAARPAACRFSTPARLSAGHPGKDLIQQVVADAARLANDVLRMSIWKNYMTGGPCSPRASCLGEHAAPP